MESTLKSFLTLGSSLVNFFVLVDITMTIKANDEWHVENND